MPGGKLRSVRLGEHLNLQFESETTIRYQIQEMLRIEKIFEEEGIQHELDAYVPLMPDGHNWKGTLLIECPDVNQRKRELARLIGVEDRLFVEVEGQPRVYAIADEDMARENGEKTSAVHFVRFELTAPMCAAVKAGAGVTLGCDPTHYPAHTQIAPETLASLAGDLSKSDSAQAGSIIRASRAGSGNLCFSVSLHASSDLACQNARF